MRGRTWALLAVVAMVVIAIGLHHDVDTHEGNRRPAAAGLPAEAITTIGLIERGGPFPYARDGIVFMNREGLLPQHPRGYWHEYTVPTPGESDRGARRIIHGAGGELYYSGDHYASFHRVTARERESR